MQLTDVSQRYDSDGSPAVAHVSVEVSRGEPVAIMGPSTPLNLIAGLDLTARCARRVIEIVDGQIASDGHVTGALR